ncbi:hypothetical protein JG688_00001822 [Phytophthora aleatoria]|uniref:CFA20 domain-containing protein n=1 Tax=Phytophthora aleatoria TaxID=2496075 RepID=A0A8J5JG59_9STRA|nr:hypothetical protein JG688_00001822 [Phytophthora aleatoria]
MAYFQGGDFVELLSAQGNAPAAAWKLQGKISKTFDKGIKGNAFSLDGNAETKMQLPKTASSALGLAQRFVILQLLVPFTRSFSVEICFSDFQKVRRRFVVASAFRDTARTTLHVQLPLNVPRDQWMNLVFDLHTLSEVHFPGSGYRSMESLCISGSCRLKRIFTMKDAPTPSRGSQVVKHADIRDIPRQFVFSATQRGASGVMPIPTQYFALESANVGGICGVAVTGKDNASSSLEIRAATGSDERAMEKERCFEARDSVSPAQMMNKSYEMKKEGIVSVTSPSLSTTNEDALEKKSEVRDMMSPRETAAKDRDDWVLIENDTAEVKHDSMINATRVDQEDKESCMDQKEEQDDSDLDLAGDMTGLSIDLTSELSASGGGSDHDPGDDSDYETSVGRARLASPHADETKPESDGDSINPHNDDRDDDASFDFEDLVEAAESADVRDEDEKKHTDYSSSQQKSASIATRLSGDHDPCPPGNQPTREKKRGPPVTPRRMKTIASPLIKSPQRSQDKVSQRESRERPVKSSRPVELSSSFSSRRLQSLLESTDWTAELNAQATNLSNSRGPPSSRSSSKPSARRSTQKRSSRPQTPSSSSIELVYDPILRCYYDPVANKYYALAE